MHTTPRFGAALVALTTPLLATPQWSKDPAANLVLSDGAGSEVQAKLAPGPNGSSYASWFDSDPVGSPAFGYDVRLQRVDASGNALWSSGGVLLADRGFSSTQDYGLDGGPTGDGYVAFRDDRFTGIQVTATRVDADGVQLWGPSGVQLTNTTDFVASPKIAGLPDGGAVVGWTQNGVTRVQRLDAAGAPQWGAGVSITGSGQASLSDLRAADADSVIVSWVRETGGFGSPRHLLAQKLDGSGAGLWGPGGVVVFDGGSLQFGNFPPFVHDGSGGGVFAWYDTTLQCYAQHVLSSGALDYGPNGIEVSTDASQRRVSPSVAWDATSSEATVFWVEQNSTQSMDGVSGQRLAAGGARLWGPTGVVLVPLGALDVTWVAAEQAPSGAVAAWIQNTGFGTDQLRGVFVDGSGSPLHPIATLASTPSSKSRLATAVGAFGDLLAAWQDDVAGDEDVLAQDLRPDGTLGPTAGTLVRTAGTNVSSYAASVGPIGGAYSGSVDLGLTGHAFAIVAFYLAPGALPFGSDVILVDLASPPGGFLTLGPQTGPVASFGSPIPNNPALCGVVVATQAAHLDLALPVRLTNAVDLYLGE